MSVTVESTTNKSKDHPNDYLHSFYNSEGKDMSIAPSNHAHTEHHESNDDMRKEEWNRFADKHQAFMQFLGDGERVLTIEPTSVYGPTFLEMTQVDPNTIVVGCIDEAVATFPGREGKKATQIGVGGSGVLMNEPQRNQFVQFLAGEIQAGKRVIVQWHEGCGAAGMAADSKDGEVVNSTAKDFATELTKDLNEKTGKTAELQAVLARDMLRQPEIHNAFGLCVDTTGKFNVTRSSATELDASKVPPLFNISDDYDQPEHVLANVDVAINIAFGDHGLKKFTPDHPFVMLIVADKTQKSMFRYGDLIKGLTAKAQQSEGKIALRTVDISAL